jgi:hypothetical protein
MALASSRARPVNNKPARIPHNDIVAGMFGMDAVRHELALLKEPS